MSETGLKVNGEFFPLPLDEVLANLTGTESLMLEEYLGGWANFDPSGMSTRTVVVLVWLAKHHAGQEVDIMEVEGMKGLVFGGTVEEVDVNPPAEAAEAAPESSPGTSETNGAPLSELSTV